MGQHPTPEPDPYRDEELEALGTPVYEGTGLSVRALTAAELQRFLDAHTGQPAQPLGSGWAALHPPPGPAGEPPGLPPVAPVGPAAGGLGSPGRSALTQYRRCRAQELAAWTRSLVWRAPFAIAAGLVVGVLARQAGLTGTLATLAGLAVAGLVGWRLRFKPSEQARAWQRGAHGEQQPPGCWTASPARATRSCTTWPCPAPPPTWITWSSAPRGRS